MCVLSVVWHRPYGEANENFHAETPFDVDVPEELLNILYCIHSSIKQCTKICSISQSIKQDSVNSVNRTIVFCNIIIIHFFIVSVLVIFPAHFELPLWNSFFLPLSGRNFICLSYYLRFLFLIIFVFYFFPISRFIFLDF